MKILYHHRIGSKDGQIVHIEEIVAALIDLGHEVVVVGPQAMRNSQFGADSGKIAALKKRLPAACYEVLELCYDLVAFVRLWRAYRRHRPDVLYERYNLFLLAGVWLKRLTGIPMLLEVNAPLAYERAQYSGLANKRIAAWAERLSWRSADRVLPVTDVLANILREAGVDRQRIVVIPNGVDAKFLADNGDGSAARAQLGLQDKVVLGFTGFIREWHGLERVINLVAESASTMNLHLLLVGDGPIVANLRQHAIEKGVNNRVTFAGLVPRHQIIDFVSTFDVALQPQVVAYASPLKLIEYMALGRAIVAPSTPNIREILVDQQNALLFDPNDHLSFSSAVERLCRDPELRKRLGKTARAAVFQQGLTWANNARRIATLFEGLLAERLSRHAEKKSSMSMRHDDKSIRP